MSHPMRLSFQEDPPGYITRNEPNKQKGSYGIGP